MNNDGARGQTDSVRRGFALRAAEKEKEERGPARLMSSLSGQDGGQSARGIETGQRPTLLRRL